MSAVLAAVGGSTIIVGFAVLMLLVLAYSYYTVKGSGIDAHPTDGRGDSPGSSAPSDVAKGRGSGLETPDSDGTFSTHGTR